MFSEHDRLFLVKPSAFHFLRPPNSIPVGEEKRKLLILKWSWFLQKLSWENSTEKKKKQLCNLIYYLSKKQCCPHFVQMGVSPVHVQWANKSRTHKESHWRVGTVRAGMLLNQGILSTCGGKTQGMSLLCAKEKFHPSPFRLDWGWNISGSVCSWASCNRFLGKWRLSVFLKHHLQLNMQTVGLLSLLLGGL